MQDVVVTGANGWIGGRHAEIVAAIGEVLVSRGRTSCPPSRSPG